MTGDSAFHEQTKPQTIHRHTVVHYRLPIWSSGHDQHPTPLLPGSDIKNQVSHTKGTGRSLAPALFYQWDRPFYQSDESIMSYKRTQTLSGECGYHNNSPMVHFMWICVHSCAHKCSRDQLCGEEYYSERPSAMLWVLEQCLLRGKRWNELVRCNHRPEF